MSTALPTAAQLTGAGITEGDFKAALQNWLLFEAGLLGADGLPATARATLKALCSASSTLSSAYAVVAADCGKTLRCTGTWTLTLPASAGVGDGFTVAVANLGSGTITLASSETIDGSATLTLSAGQSLIVACNGASWAAIGKGASLSGILALGFVRTINSTAPDSAGNFVIPVLNAAAITAALGFTPPPAPNTGSGVGQFVGLAIPVGGYGLITLPSGGTWAYSIAVFDGRTFTGVAAGGTYFSPNGVGSAGFAWRIA